ncbi:peptidase associated/transthyretin-like domain-containing protein [Seonamhaeicola marinus]|uniref:Intradiol ring-cleavage dioxygenase n=1 Tax=Seonamhaeicola marinus TaxID=1912246 RepID=A0A5D0J7I1_9FLAO|nr:intradiol ring-cleavage dioxygenase [Seonamhaeicola marinus]TYA92335.1 intradiol ring-cleavage dioxygenase [Seonamhaeicola marinus]
MKKSLGILLLTLFAFSCKGQSNSDVERNVGGPCQDCKAVLDFKELNIKPKSTDTLPGFENNEPKIKITGTAFKRDGKTPAENILLYVYHVDRNGIYQPSETPVGWEKRHGQFRGWLKTGTDGKFTFYTFRPLPYPEVQEPEHIHIYVKEPNTIPYYIDSYLFESDPTLTEDKKQSLKNRGGSGIIKLKQENGIWTANRDLILGLNIPDYE